MNSRYRSEPDATPSYFQVIDTQTGQAEMTGLSEGRAEREAERLNLGLSMREYLQFRQENLTKH